MSQSPLQLERYFFVKALIQAQPKPDPHAINKIEASVEVGKAEGKETLYMVSLNLRLKPREGNTPAYLGEIVIVGFFRVHSDYPPEKRDQLVGINGASILYGAAREMVANLTARGPWPAVSLVSIRFSDVMDQNRKSVGQPSGSTN